MDMWFAHIALKKQTNNQSKNNQNSAEPFLPLLSVAELHRPTSCLPLIDFRGIEAKIYTHIYKLKKAVLFCDTSLILE